MTQYLAKKMHRIASQVDGLNEKGKVKAQTGNDQQWLQSVGAPHA